MAKPLAVLQAELIEQQSLVEALDEVLALGDDDDLISQKAVAVSKVLDIEKQIAETKSANHESSVPPPPPPQGQYTKNDKSSIAAPPPPPEEAPVIFNVKDKVQAKWAGDKQWYDATIITKTGSSSDPVYTVKFKIDNSSETKRKNEVRPLFNNKKRKAEDAASTSVSTPPVSSAPVANGAVITAAPVLDKSALPKKEPSMVGDGPTRMAPEKKKLKGGKLMEKKKSNWQDFMSKGPKNAAITGPKKKESMFKTPDAPNARVGFVNSGKPMTKDPKRAKFSNVHHQEDADDDGK